MQAALVIPARNAAHSLPGVLEAVLRVLPPAAVLVVDDASSDATAEVARAHAVQVLEPHMGELHGKGAALRKGFRFWLAKGVECIATLDADGQHDPARLPELVRLFEEQQLDLLIGDRGFRQHASSMPWDRRFSNRVTTALLNLRTGFQLRDSQCGYRVIRSWLVADDSFYCTGFDFESELLLAAADRGARVGQASIPLVYNDAGSHMNRLRDTLAFMRLYWRHLMRRTGHGSGA